MQHDKMTFQMSRMNLHGGCLLLLLLVLIGLPGRQHVGCQHRQVHSIEYHEEKVEDTGKPPLVTCQGQDQWVRDQGVILSIQLEGEKKIGLHYLLFNRRLFMLHQRCSI